MQKGPPAKKERTHSVSSSNIDPNGHITLLASRDELIAAVKRMDALLPDVPPLASCTPDNLEQWLVVLSTRLKLLGLHDYVFATPPPAPPTPRGPPTADDRHRMLTHQANEMRAKCQLLAFVSAEAVVAVKKAGFDEFATSATELFLALIKWAGGKHPGGNQGVQETLKELEALGVI